MKSNQLKLWFLDSGIFEKSIVHDCTDFGSSLRQIMSQILCPIVTITVSMGSTHKNSLEKLTKTWFSQILR